MPFDPYWHERRQQEQDDLLARGLWENRGGTVEKISDMSMQHIHSCMVMIKKKQWRLGYLPLLSEEYEKRRRAIWQ